MDIVEFLRARLAEDEEASGGPEYRYGHTDACDWWGDEPGYCTCGGRRRAWREVEAKRVAIDWYEHDDDVVMAATIYALAAVYADHPDYDPDWQ